MEKKTKTLDFTIEGFEDLSVGLIGINSKFSVTIPLEVWVTYEAEDREELIRAIKTHLAPWIDPEGKCYTDEELKAYYEEEY